MNYFFYLLVFLIPFMAMSPLLPLLGVPQGVIYAVLVMIFAIGMWFEKPYRLRLKNIAKTPLMVPLWVFFGATIISFARLVLLGGTGAVKLDHLEEVGYLAFSIVFYWVVVSFVDTREKLVGSLQVFVASATAVSLYGLIRMFLYMIGSKYGAASLWTVPRLTATAGEPQVFGGFIISILPLVIAVILYKVGWMGLTLHRLAAPILVLALVMTYSAGAWAGFGASLVFLAVWLSYYNFKRVLAVGLVFAVVGLSIVLIDKTIYPNYFEAFSSISFKITGKVPPAEKFEGKDTYQTLAEYSLPSPESKDFKYLENLRSKVERSWFRIALWNMFKSSPVFGVGPGNFGALYNQFRPAGSENPPYLPKPHNQYMEIMAETGILGVLAFAYVIMGLCSKIIRAWLNGSAEIRKMLAGLVASLLAVAVHGYSFGVLVHLQVWLLLALTLALTRIADKTAGGRYI